MNKSLPILVVDDQWPMRQSLTLALRDIGFDQVIQAANGLEAMRALSEAPVAAVISDWNMPGMSGLGLLRWLRSQPDKQDVPFMLVTVETDSDHMRQAVAAGVSEYLVKPYTVQDLANKMKRMLGRALAEGGLDAKQARRVLGLAQAGEVEPRLGGATILVVDDVMANIEVIAAALSGDYPVLGATSGDQALAFAHAAPPPDLILLDVSMPGLDGHEVCRRLKTGPATRSIPIIFLTGNDRVQDVVEGLELGAVDYIAKPAEPAILKARIRTHLRLKLAMADLACQNTALAASARLREDVARITQHDLKNPIAAIISATDLLLAEGALGPQQAEVVRMMQSEAWRALDQVNQSLSLYRMETGSFVLKPEPVDLAVALTNAQREVSKVLAVREPVFRISASDGSALAPGRHVVRGEPGLCHSLFGNLLRNAVEAAPPGSTVTVGLDRDGDFVRVSIRNAGAVPFAIRERFFDKYVTAGKADGTGLGTYSAKLVTEAQHGRISMTTDDADGTTVTVWLPQYPAA